MQNLTYIKGFHAIRAISVLLVVMDHLDISDVWIKHNDFTEVRTWPMFSGDFGVCMFFCLSGFLITRILLNEWKSVGRINLRNFFVRRALRLVPPLIIYYGLLGTAILAGYYLENTRESILYAVFYVYNFVPILQKSEELMHFWSLGVEEQFYMTWPFVMALIKDKRKLIGYLLVMILVCIFALFYHYHFAIGVNHFFTKWFIPAVAPILVGCIGAFVVDNDHPKLVRFFKSKWIVPILIIVLYCYPIYTPFCLMPLMTIVHSVSICLLLFRIYYSQHTKWVQCMEFVPLKYIGTISYGIYVYQGFFLRTVSGSELWFQQPPFNITASIIIAILSYHLVEKPILKIKTKF